jgi:hypothetical protein
MSAGLAHAIKKVWEFPPKESCRILVNFESLYGINYLPSDNAAITLPKLSNPLFIFIPK